MEAKRKQRADLAAERYDEQRESLRPGMVRTEADAAFFANVLKAPASAAQQTRRSSAWSSSGSGRAQDPPARSARSAGRDECTSSASSVTTSIATRGALTACFSPSDEVRYLEVIVSTSSKGKHNDDLQCPEGPVSG